MISRAVSSRAVIRCASVGVLACALAVAPSAGALAAVDQPVVVPAPAGTTEVGQWRLDTVTRYPTGPGYLASRLSPGSGPDDPGDDLRLDPDATVRQAAAGLVSPGGAQYFPGWKDGAPLDGKVNDTASSAIGPVRDYLDPGGSRFVVSVYVKPTHIDTRANPSLANDTENIVQKGIHDGPGGQWKVSVDNDTMQAVCTFRDAAFVAAGIDGQTGREVRSRTRLPSSRGTRIQCKLDRGQVTISLWESDGTLRESRPPAFPVADAFSVTSDEPLWMGKKPSSAADSRKAADAYSGVIDDLQVFRGP